MYTFGLGPRSGPVFAPDGPASGGTPSGSSSPGGGTTPSSTPSPGAAPAPSGASPSTSTVAPGTEPRPGATNDAPSTTTGATPDAGDSMDFSAIFDGPSDAGGQTPEPATPQPAVQPADGGRPQAPEPQVVQPQTPVASQPAPSPQEVTSGDAQRPQLDPSDPVAIHQALVANESAVIEHVASTMFRLSPEEIEALESNTVETIPKLLAKGFVKSQQNLLHQLGALVPKMMQKQIEALRRNSQGEGKFFQRWPALKEHSEMVRRLAATYRQMNPSMKLDQMIEDLGPIALMAAKLPMQNPTAGPAQPQASPMAAPAATNGVRQPQPSPFVPAMGGPGASPHGQELSDVEAMFLTET